MIFFRHKSQPYDVKCRTEILSVCVVNSLGFSGDYVRWTSQGLLAWREAADGRVVYGCRRASRRVVKCDREVMSEREIMIRRVECIKSDQSGRLERFSPWDKHIHGVSPTNSQEQCNGRASHEVGEG